MTLFPLRRVRSFVRRDGRMTDAQKRALDSMLPRVGLNLHDGVIDFSAVFGRATKTNLEIGFGSGQSLFEMAKSYPAENFIGIETYLPGVGSLLGAIEETELSNIRVYYADAVEVLQQCIPEESLDVVQIFFPDPWPKRKHHKRRLIQENFVKLILSRLKKNGMIHLATDWQHYAEQMMTVLSSIPELKNAKAPFEYADRSSQRPIVTKFEKRGQQSGRDIWELQFVKG